MSNHFKSILTSCWNTVPAVHERREKIRLAEAAGKEHNFLQGLIKYVTTDENDAQLHLSVEQIAQSVLLLAFASVHNTSTNLSLTIYWLLARPDLMEKLIAEIQRVIPGENEPNTPEALSKNNL